MADIPIAVPHGRNGFPAAIGAVFPRSAAQTRIVRLIRDSLDSVGWKDRGAPMPSVRAICQAATAETAGAALDAVEAGPRARRCPAIAPMRRRGRERGVAVFVFPPAIGRTIYTTNAVESLNWSVGKVIETRGGFASDEAALTLLYMAIRHAGLRWKPAIAWREAKPGFTILFGGCIARSVS